MLNLTPRQTRLLNGVLLGNAKIVDADSRPHPYVREKSEREEYIDWLVDEFESVDARKYRADDKHEFQIPPHEKLENWRKRWYYKGKRVIPISDNFKLTSDMASLWYARRGEWDERYGRVKLEMSGLPDSMKNGTEVLKDAGFEPFKSFSCICLRDDSAREFLDWLEDVPGHEKKFDRYHE